MAKKGSGVSITMEASRADMKALSSKLAYAEKTAPKHIKNAVNRALTKAKRQIKASRRRAYDISDDRFEKDVTYQRASPTRLSASIRAYGRPPTIKNFNVADSRATGVMASVAKEGLKRLEAPGKYSKAFFAKGGKAADRVLQRRIGHEGKRGGKFRVPYGPSVPKMLEKLWSGDRGGVDIEEYAQGQLHAEIAREIEKITAGGGK